MLYSIIIIIPKLTRNDTLRLPENQMFLSNKKEGIKKKFFLKRKGSINIYVPYVLFLEKAFIISASYSEKIF